MDEQLNLLIEKIVKLSSSLTSGEITKLLATDKDIKEINGFFLTYPFTTENISGYIDLFDLKNKSLLTVGSSGDQAVNAILKGCKDVTILDINPFVKYYFYLKKAGILTLSYSEFLKFFCYRYYNYLEHNSDAFNLESYNKLKETLKELDEESFLFWDTVFNKCNGNVVRRAMFKYDEVGLRVVKKVNPYLKNRFSFQKTKFKIANINPKFISGDIFKTKLHRTYDNIFLSNIAAYNTQEKLKKLVEELSINLNEEGKLLICYLYDTIKDTPYMNEWPEIYDMDKFNKLFAEYISSFDSFQGVNNIRYFDRKIKDSVVTYKKKKVEEVCKK